MLYEELSAYDNLKFYSYLHRKGGQWARKMLREFGIPNKKVKQLSGGMKKRLSIHNQRRKDSGNEHRGCTEKVIDPFTALPDGPVKNDSVMLHYTDNPREDIARIV